MFACYGHFYLLLLLTLSMNSNLLLIEKHSAEKYSPGVLSRSFPLFIERAERLVCIVYIKL